MKNQTKNQQEIKLKINENQSLKSTENQPKPINRISKIIINEKLSTQTQIVEGSCILLLMKME